MRYGLSSIWDTEITGDCDCEWRQFRRAIGSAVKANRERAWFNLSSIFLIDYRFSLFKQHNPRIVEMLTINIDTLICFRCGQPSLVSIGTRMVCWNCGIDFSEEWAERQGSELIPTVGARQFKWRVNYFYQETVKLANHIEKSTLPIHKGMPTVLSYCGCWYHSLFMVRRRRGILFLSKFR